MKIESITIQGFRGFNEARTFTFHNALTLIHGPNSYGKTSISEALEWLLYGVTSKVEKAESKDEFKGCYRNCHLAPSLAPFVEAVFVDGSNRYELRGDLGENDQITRSFNGSKVDNWPLGFSATPKPFVLQHALKYLLWAKPDERFQAFARLLGLEDLDQAQKDFTSLATKPEARVPREVKEVLDNASRIEASLALRVPFAAISKALKKGKAGLPEVYRLLLAEAKKRAPQGTPDDRLGLELNRQCEEARSRVLGGRLSIEGFSEQDIKANADDEQYFLSLLSEEFASKYMELAALDTVSSLMEIAQFLGVGLRLTERNPDICPFCGQDMGSSLLEHVREQHAEVSRQTEHVRGLTKQRAELESLLTNLETRISSFHTRHVRKAANLPSSESMMAQIKTILGTQNEHHFKSLEKAVQQIEPSKQNLGKAYAKVSEAFKALNLRIGSGTPDSSLLKDLAGSLNTYIVTARSFSDLVANILQPVTDVIRILQAEIDKAAGTEEIAALVDLFQHWGTMKKACAIRDILEGLKDLKKSVDTYVASTVYSLVSTDLTTKVMKWYDLIRTTVDPDVHFNGFDMERTKSGELKARRIQVKAASYGKDLVSAVSSLSESKLNALGLAISISTNLSKDCPFGFLFIDDPIQSWDDQHETQFIEVILKLVEEGKQVILLSHQSPWLDSVRTRCRMLNGRYYQITGYTRLGPHVQGTSWEKWSNRLDLVDAILKDPGALEVKMQQAEEEIRLVVTDVTSQIYLRHKGQWKDPGKLNSKDVARLLTECGVDSGLVQRIVMTFKTTDEAHHVSSKYQPDRQRLRCYHSWAHELGKLLDDRKP
ncbi:MAG: AAA family ATPase [Firmicutes bacterium]|nr:AAA family ATPase [Bacillota bacterium]